MKFDMEPYRAALNDLCRTFQVARLDLVGSAAAGDFDPARSDLDFLVEFQFSASADQFDRYFGMLESLRSLFSRRVDLMETHCVTNPFVRGQMERQRIPLFAAA